MDEELATAFGRCDRKMHIARNKASVQLRKGFRFLVILLCFSRLADSNLIFFWRALIEPLAIVSRKIHLAKHFLNMEFHFQLGSSKKSTILVCL